MKITPIEIRQKTFEKGFRGYEKEEVDAFLVSLSQEWERVVGDVQELKNRLANSEADVKKLREVESSLYRTLKTAEDTGASMVQQANKDAELQLREAQMQAEAILNDAKNEARDLIDESEMRAREISADLRDELKKMESNYRTLEAYRDNLVSEMKTFAKGTLDRLDGQKFQKIDFAAVLKSANQEFESSISKNSSYDEEMVIKPVAKSEEEPFISREVVLEIEGEIIDTAQPIKEPEDLKNESLGNSKGSFFDSLD